MKKRMLTSAVAMLTPASMLAACGITIFVMVAPWLRRTARPPSVCPISTDWIPEGISSDI